MSIDFRQGLAALLTVLALVGCGPVSVPLQLEDPTLNQVWPAPPDISRIKLLRSLEGVEDLVDQTQTKNRLFRWLTGDMAEQVPLVSPYGIATDGQGTIWVTDPGAHAVHVLDLKRRRGRLWTLAGDELFLGPAGIAYDPSRERVYVADAQLKKVVAFSRQGKVVASLAPEIPFGRPGGMAVDMQGNLLVADVIKGVIRRFSPTGEELPELGSPTTPNGHFNRPIGLALDGNGLIYVIDSLNFRIEVIDPAGEAVASIGELGDQPGTFSRPRGIAVDSFGHIYVADAAFDNIQIFNLKGQLLLVFGGGGEHGLSLPAGLSVDAQDRIYAVDSFNHRIQIYQFLGNVD